MRTPYQHWHFNGRKLQSPTNLETRDGLSTIRRPSRELGRLCHAKKRRLIIVCDILLTIRLGRDDLEMNQQEERVDDERTVLNENQKTCHCTRDASELISQTHVMKRSVTVSPYQGSKDRQSEDPLTCRQCNRNDSDAKSSS